MKDSIRYAVLVALVSCGAAQAQTLADEINRHQAQIQILDSREQLNKALQRAADPILSQMPRILAISGWEGDLAARLILANGTTGSFKEGDTVRGSMKVVGITHKAVMVSMGSPRSKKPVVMALEFVPGAKSGTNQSGQNMNGGASASNQSDRLGNVGSPMPIPVELLPAPPRVNLGLPSPQVATAAKQTQPTSAPSEPAAAAESPAR